MGDTVVENVFWTKDKEFNIQKSLSMLESEVPALFNEQTISKLEIGFMENSQRQQL